MQAQRLPHTPIDSDVLFRRCIKSSTCQRQGSKRSQCPEAPSRHMRGKHPDEKLPRVRDELEEILVTRGVQIQLCVLNLKGDEVSDTEKAR